MPFSSGYSKHCSVLNTAGTIYQSTRRDVVEGLNVSDVDVNLASRIRTATVQATFFSTPYNSDGVPFLLFTDEN
jgi:hypothetical protein